MIRSRQAAKFYIIRLDLFEVESSDCVKFVNLFWNYIVEFKKGFNLYKSYFSAFFIKISIKLYEMNSVSSVFYRDITILPKGYEFYRMLPNSIVNLDDSPVYNETFAFQNILAVPNKYNLDL